ncbi:MAG: SAM-dependent methyltransferase [Deltaproteobacteria bacterium]|nr:MAG: SAM-dependent methyltransferase [Deltaproteobacteria bacterium]
MNFAGSSPKEKRNKERFVKEAFSSIAKRYDLANTLLSLGIDSWWRKRARDALGERPLVLDLCAGTLSMTRSYLDRWRGGRVIALDFSLDMLLPGRKRLKRREGRCSLVLGDALALPFPAGTFSGVMMAFGLRNLVDLQAGLAEIFRVLGEGGKAVILEFGHPTLPLFRQLYRLYLSRVIPSLGGWITGRKEAYSYLFRSIDSFPSREEILGMMQKVGFKGLRASSLTLGICVLYQGEKV